MNFNAINSQALFWKELLTSIWINVRICFIKTIKGKVRMNILILNISLTQTFAEIELLPDQFGPKSLNSDCCRKFGPKWEAWLCSCLCYLQSYLFVFHPSAFNHYVNWNLCQCAYFLSSQKKIVITLLLALGLINVRGIL